MGWSGWRRTVAGGPVGGAAVFAPYRVGDPGLSRSYVQAVLRALHLDRPPSPRPPLSTRRTGGGQPRRGSVVSRAGPAGGRWRAADRRRHRRRGGHPWAAPGCPMWTHGAPRWSGQLTPSRTWWRRSRRQAGRGRRAGRRRDEDDQRPGRRDRGPEADLGSARGDRVGIRAPPAGSGRPRPPASPDRPGWR